MKLDANVANKLSFNQLFVGEAQQLSFLQPGPQLAKTQLLPMFWMQPGPCRENSEFISVLRGHVRTQLL